MGKEDGVGKESGRGAKGTVHMVKSLVAIGVAAAMLLGLAVFEWFFVEEEFSAFREELISLYDKTDGGTANAEDARVVQGKWEDRKERLHIWIPHNDIARIDEYMAETVRLIGEEEYTLALPKLEVLIHLSECLPGTYKPAAENIF